MLIYFCRIVLWKDLYMNMQRKIKLIAVGSLATMIVMVLTTMWATHAWKTTKSPQKVEYAQVYDTNSNPSFIDGGGGCENGHTVVDKPMPCNTFTDLQPYTMGERIVQQAVIYGLGLMVSMLIVALMIMMLRTKSIDRLESQFTS